MFFFLAAAAAADATRPRNLSSSRSMVLKSSAPMARASFISCLLRRFKGAGGGGEGVGAGGAEGGGDGSAGGDGD